MAVDCVMMKQRPRRPVPNWAVVLGSILVSVSVFAVIVFAQAHEAPAPIPNLYAEALSGIHRGVALPISLPPDTVWVFLTSSGGNEVASFQHSDVMVNVCRFVPGYRCGEYAQPLRSFRFHGNRFIIVYVPLSKLPPPPGFTIPRQIARFWKTTSFVGHQPEWLTMDLYPGGAYAS